MTTKTRNLSFLFSLILILVIPVHSISAEEPVTIATYLTWFPAFGSLNGCNSWSLDEFGYKNSAKGGIRNYPYPPKSQQEKHPLTDFNPTTPKEAFENSLSHSKIQAMLDQELDDMKKAGFDIIAIDILPIPPTATHIEKVFCSTNAVEYIGKRAIKKGIKSVILSDIMNLSDSYPQGRVMSSAEWEKIYQNMIQKAQNWEWYWKKDGKYPVILQFGAGEGAIIDEGTRLNGAKAILQWNKIKEKLDAQNLKGMYFYDFRHESIPVLYHNKDDNIGGFVFAPGSPQGLVNQLTFQIKKSSHDVIWTVSPGYYNQGFPVFFAPDFSRIHKAYTEAIKDNANKILFVTWNDFLEDTDIAPSHNKGYALINLVTFYNEWFKTRIQPVRNKSILIFASPLRSPETVTSRPPTWAQGKGKNFNEDQTHQKIYYWLYTPKDSETNLYLNDSILNELSAGKCANIRGCISMGSIPLNGRISGSITLERTNENGEKLLSERRLFFVTPTKVETQRSGTGGLEYYYQILEK